MSNQLRLAPRSERRNAMRANGRIRDWRKLNRFMPTGPSGRVTGQIIVIPPDAIPSSAEKAASE